MELRALRYFLAVARKRNMTEAAIALHVTQPTLSRQISELEAELGTRLFTRTNRSTIPTEVGLRLRQRAEEILSLVTRMEDEAKDGEVELSGCIRIGTVETCATRMIAEAFASLLQSHPKVTCELLSGDADTVEERLEHGLLDFGLLLGPVKFERYECLRLPTTELVGIVTRSDSDWAERSCVTPRDLQDMPLLRSSHINRQLLDLTTWSGGTLDVGRLRLVGHFDLIANATPIVKSGAANALCIDGLPSLTSDDLAFVPLEPTVRVGASVIWKRHRSLSRASAALLERLRSMVAQDT